MSVETTRRSVLMGALGLAGAMTFFGAAYAETTRLRLAWWGGNERTRRTQEVLKLYQQHVTGVELAGEVSNSEYFTKLATQVVGRSAPDIFQLEPNSFADFVKRDCVLALDGLMPNPIDAAGISRAMLDLCAVDGKIWGIPQALNSFAMMYDKDAFATAGVAPPDAQTSWDDYADRMVELTKALNRRRYWGSCDASGYSYAFQVWLRQRGRDLFTADQALGFGKDDVAEWFAYWDKLRQRGGCVPADVAALSPDSTINLMPLIQGKAATSFAFSNQIVGMQATTPVQLAMTMFPNGGAGAKPGQFYRPASSWSIYAQSPNPEAAARFVNFFVSDPEAAKILGVERGVPMSPALRASILPTLRPVERATVEYIDAIADKVGPYPPPPPKGSQQFGQLMKRAADAVAFNSASISDSAATLMKDAHSIL
ncbi:ABC transporter substrate-binding protein [Rhizobium sp. AP16]|uniref:ABC transporter substrate-binding protein n=1 Tax=Rhizobium sp. AP16 TaxID=1144306 RepID=UPI00026EC931|nr:ABC transporter substrate-binding protein [Rhizobium sp. AP16]EJK87925.1 ABC-type sugar transport system, periplasmic component [Rhizobium sp. AP16]